MTSLHHRVLRRALGRSLTRTRASTFATAGGKSWTPAGSSAQPTAWSDYTRPLGRPARTTGGAAGSAGLGSAGLGSTGSEGRRQPSGRRGPRAAGRGRSRDRRRGGAGGRFGTVADPVDRRWTWAHGPLRHWRRRLPLLDVSQGVEVGGGSTPHGPPVGGAHVDDQEGPQARNLGASDGPHAPTPVGSAHREESKAPGGLRPRTDPP